MENEPTKAEILKALTELSVAAGEADALQHSGLDIPANVWGRIYDANVSARALLAKASQ